MYDGEKTDDEFWYWSDDDEEFNESSKRKEESASSINEAENACMNYVPLVFKEDSASNTCHYFPQDNASNTCHYIPPVYEEDNASNAFHHFPQDNTSNTPMHYCITPSLQNYSMWSCASGSGQKRKVTDTQQGRNSTTSTGNRDDFSMSSINSGMTQRKKAKGNGKDKETNGELILSANGHPKYLACPYYKYNELEYAHCKDLHYPENQLYRIK